ASTGGTIRDVKVNIGDKVSKGTVIATVATTAPRTAAATLRQARGDTGVAREGDTGAATREGDTGVAREGDTGVATREGDTGVAMREGETAAATVRDASESVARDDVTLSSSKGGRSDEGSTNGRPPASTAPSASPPQ